MVFVCKKPFLKLGWVFLTITRKCTRVFQLDSPLKIAFPKELWHKTGTTNKTTTKQNKTKQNKTKQNKTKQKQKQKQNENKTKNKTKQNKANKAKQNITKQQQQQKYRFKLAGTILFSILRKRSLDQDLKYPFPKRII